MREDLELALVRDFPLLYSHLMYFECDDGWEPLIRRLSEQPEPMIAAIADDDERAACTAVQVKQKFRGLRFYMSTSSKEMNDLIWRAECDSFSTCEVCGAPGKGTVRSGWHITACERHT